MCARCEELEERIAYLEGELGLRIGLDEISALHRAYGLTPSEGRLVLALYRAKGRVCSLLQLEDSVVSQNGRDDRDLNIITVFICKARKKLGRDLIVNEWGRGYALSPRGLEQISALLAPLQPRADLAA